MMNWLKIIATLTMLSFFSNANAEGYCDSTGASEDADGVITFTGAESAMGDCAFAPDEYTMRTNRKLSLAQKNQTSGNKN